MGFLITFVYMLKTMILMYDFLFLAILLKTKTILSF